jgi:lipopolysaccharide assembly LptE-like protein
MKLSFTTIRFLTTIALAGLMSSGCGYESNDVSVGGYQWKSIYRTDVHTVCVPIFETKDFHRGVEFSVSSAIVHEIEAATPYKVVARDHADTILEGEIVSVRTTPLSLSQESDVPQEELASVVINFTWKDLRSGKVLVQKKNFGQSAAYYPTLAEGEFAGTQDAAEKLAAEVVHTMEAAW